MDVDKQLIAILFGETLREIRAKKKISQEELALETGIARSFLSELERGVKQPTLSTIFALAKCLNMKVKDVVSRVEEKQRKIN